ncbi:hypothetical protein NL676_004714 [Syzygium grande]|nr:hypothetical protein NL676_004714 [Syzygium grande]
MYPLHPHINARSEQGQRGLNYQMSTAQAVKLNTCHGRACVADNCRVNSSTVPQCIDYVSLRELFVVNSVVRLSDDAGSTMLASPERVCDSPRVLNPSGFLAKLEGKTGKGKR